MLFRGKPVHSFLHTNLLFPFLPIQNQNLPCINLDEILVVVGVVEDVKEEDENNDDDVNADSVDDEEDKDDGAQGS
ncbi:hypothetical protein QVD17_35267 [Tagetes erecta]|uniref:Uncharacterized protein n=1 Tax=Tagetes erecta TaxID=13708 RepID=A0AAD8NME3_TARER|nr:hypothetical protein QVD17_35267 [Tagetes erecta]